MRFFLLIIFLGFIQFTQAQDAFELELSTLSGFEYNPFNTTVRSFGIDTTKNKRPDIQSGFFQHFNIMANWKKEILKHKFDLKGRFRVDYFPQLRTANLFRPELRFNYSYQLKKKTFLKFRANYFANIGNDLIDPDEVLRISNSYQKGGLAFGYQFQLNKKTKLLVESSYLKKYYAPVEEQRLRYGAIGFKLKSTTRIKRKDKYAAYLTLAYEFNNRNYRDFFEEEFLEEEEPVKVLEKTRVWQYHTLRAGYAFRPNKVMRYKVGVSLQQRIDQLDEEFGYSQLETYAEVKYKNERLELKWRVAVTHRRFSTLFADQEEDILLVHNYLRNRVTLNYQLKKQCYLSLQSNITKRWRNQPVNANKAFLPYMNGLISIGVKFIF